MEPEITERVGESSSRRTRPPRQQIRKSLAESPSPLPKSSQKKRKRRKESGEYYLVRRILDEKTENDEISYLIDWEDNEKTGEPYAPTWEPYDNVNQKAIDEWVARPRQDQAKRENQRSTLDTSQQQPPSLDPYPTSELIRTSKRQRTNRSPNPSSSGQPPANKPRRAGTVETARFQSVSQETVDSEGKPKEIKDSYEDEQSLSNGSERIRVEIPVDQEFDRGAYARVAVVSSQPSQATQPSQNSQSSRPSNSSSQSHFKNLTPRLFLWDEEDDGIPIIPDSQELPGSSSYKPTETPTSKTSVATRTGTAINTEGDGTALRSSAISIGSIIPGHRQSQPPSYPSRVSNFENESEATSSQVDRSVLPSISGQHFSTSVEDSQDGQQFHQSSPFESVGTPGLSAGSRARPETFVSAGSSHLSGSSENPLASLARGTRSQEAAHILSQVQPSSSEVGHVSQLQYRAQLPVPSQDENSTPNANLHVTQGSHNDFHNRQSPRSEIETQTVCQKSAPATPPTPTQRSVSSFEATSQAAQIGPVSPRFYTQDAQIIFEEVQISPATTESQDVTSQTPTIPALHNLDVNTQKSPSKSQDRVSSTEGSTSLPHPKRRDSPLEASENVLPSIENIAEAVSSPTPSRPSPPSSGVVKIPGYYTPSPRSSASNARMADPAMDEMSTAEKLKLARQAAAENTMARQRAARTASAIPHTPPPPGPPPVNQMLPLRETAPEATAILAPSPRVSPEREIPPTHLQILPLGENVYTVPLSMVALARDVYDKDMTNYRPQRRSLLNDDEIDTRLVADIDTMIERLKLICDHEDLIEDSATQQMESDHRKARWAENISTKCVFLAEFFDSLRSINTHVLVLVRPGRMMDILEALFRTHGYIYTRPDRPSSQSGQGLLKISLLPTDAGERHFGLEPAFMVIAFDSTFVNGPYVESLRRDPTKANWLAPRVHLVITHSIEHLELCIKKDMNQLDRKAMLVHSLSHIREEMGKLDPDYLLAEPAAKAVADFLVDGASGEWPLLPMPYIEGIDVPETPTEPNSSGAQPSGSTMQSYDISSALLQPAPKRPMLDEEDSESSKRQRLTPVGGVSSSGVDISRVNETSLDTSGGAGNLGSEAATAREIVPKADTLDATKEDQVSALLKKVSELENQLRSKEATETELRQFNQRLEARCEDYENSIAKIQPKYQEALNDRGQAQQDVEESKAREASIRQKLDARTADLAKVREEKALADAALVHARATLSSSAIPEVAELQKLKDELNAARYEAERFQKKISIAAGDMEYMRNNYQKASSAAAEMRTELDALKTLNETLSRKASANAVEIHRIQASSEIKQDIQRISELEGENAELERELEKRTEELKSVLNGRRPTRGSSVPKSPRMGSTMSPGQSSRPMARVMGGVGSRGPSPGPGGAEGQFRGPATFGDALFAPMPGSNRWGNHLN